MKLKIAIGLLVGIFAFLLPFIISKYQPIRVIVNGEKIIFDINPFLEDEMIFVPIRNICAAFDALIKWDHTTKTVVIYKDCSVIQLTVNKDVAYKNGNAIHLDMPVKIFKDKLFVPISILSESLDLEVALDDSFRTVTIENTVNNLYCKQIIEHVTAGDLVSARQVAFAAPLINPFPRLEYRNEGDSFLSVFFPEGEATRYYVIENNIMTYVEPVGGVFTVVWQARKPLPGEEYEILPADDTFTSFINTEIAVEHGLRPLVGKPLDFFQKQLPANYTEYGHINTDGTLITRGRINTAALILEESKIMIPRIDLLKVQNTEFKIGEKIQYLYTFQSTNGIAEEEWRYQFAEDNSIINGNPRAFFRPGNYTVFLRIRDASGKWSNTASVSFTISKDTVMNELAYRFSNPTSGEKVYNYEGINYNLLASNQTTTIMRSGSTLHLSNGPEKVANHGILYKAEASGNFRLLYHHMNYSVSKQNLYIIAENESSKTVTLKQLKSGVAGPSSDYLYVGQMAATRYLSSKSTYLSIIKPGEKLILNPDMRYMKHMEAVTGMQDYEVDGNITLYVVMGPQKMLDPAQVNLQMDSLLKLPEFSRPSGRVRGAFLNNECLVDIKVNGEQPEKITLGIETTEYDTWVAGIDSMAGDRIINIGNYGIVYKIRVTAPSKTGVLLNPRGSHFRGAFECPDGIVYKVPDVHYFTNISQSAVLGVVEAGQTVEFLYTPSCGSDTPVIIAFIPEKFWRSGL